MHLSSLAAVLATSVVHVSAVVLPIVQSGTFTNSTTSTTTQQPTLAPVSVAQNTTSSTYVATVVDTEVRTTTLSATSTVTSTLGAAPSATLIPAIHWDVDTSAISHLQPQTSNTVFYSSNQNVSPYVQQQIANLDIAFNYPAIVLDHSAYATPAYVDQNTINVQFSDAAAYQYASSNWQSASPANPLIFMGYIPGSPSANDGDRHYAVSQKVTCDASSAVCTISGQNVGFEGVANNFTVEWGQYTPDTNATAAMVLPRTNQTNTTNSSIALPQCMFGDTFDQCLDNQLGYLNFSSSDFATDFQNFAGFSAADAGIDQDDFAFSKRSLEKRGWFSSFRRFVSSAVSVATSVVKATLTAVVKVAQAIPIIKDIVNKVPAADFPRVTSPWSQDSISIYSSKESETKKIDIWCVDCGVKGQINIQGKLAASIASLVLTGPTEAYLGVNGNLLAGIFIGIQAQIQIKKDFDEKPIFRSGLPGLTIPNIISVGPFLTVGTKLSLGLEANGQLIAGGNISFPDFSARMDLVNPSASFQKGFVPVIGKRFEAEGSVQATADIGFPIGVALGVDVLGGKYTKSVALVEQPGVQFHAKAAVSASLQNGLQSTNGDCNGISYGFSFVNNVFYKIGDNTNSLFKNSIPIADACLVIPGLQSQATTTGSASSLPTSATASDNGSSVSASDTQSNSPTTTSQTEPTTNPEPSTTGASVAPNDNESSNPTSTSADPAGNAPEATTSSTPSGESSDPATTQSKDSETSEPNIKRSFIKARQADSSAGSSAAAPAASSAADSSDFLTLSDDDDSTELGNYTIPDALADDVPDTTANQDDGTQTAIITDFSSQYKIIQSDDSNLYLQYGNDTSDADPTAYAFSVSDSSTVLTLSSGEYMHYYTTEMSAYGVSRFRTGFTSETPKTTKLAFFDAVNYDDSTSTPDALVVYDADGGIFYPIVCTVENKGTQIFLASDIDKGITSLRSSALQNSVTGGVVDDCFFVSFQLSFIADTSL